ncbi:MAG: FAD:protein FMN transferase [Acidobacteria bacterium]|nr:FAD:protein FMN transferase [Acidobacteriota bacterium]
MTLDTLTPSDTRTPSRRLTPRHLAQAVLLAACAVLATDCGPPAAEEARPGPLDGAPPAAQLVEQTYTTMGTELHLRAWTTDAVAAGEAFEAVFTEFDRLDALLSVWREGSDVVRLNLAAGREPVRVSADTLEVLQLARQLSEWTDGKFDVTFGALSGLWKFDHDQDDRIPARAEVARRLPLIDYRALVIDEAAGTAFLARAGMSAHLGGIGKGYALDRGAAILRARGIDDFLIQSGGDLYAGGLRDGAPWRLGIRDPRGPEDQVFARLDVSDATFSTSGDYERAFLENGRRYHHIIDPDTGEPAQGCRSVTIVARQAAIADALSTGVFLLGPARGMALVERLPDVDAVIVTDRNEVLVSSGLSDRLVRLAPPTDAP